MLGCYRRGDAEDPETYATAVAAVLAEYSPAIVQRVTDPRTGLAGRSKFLPTVSEVREACEAEAAVVERAAKRERAVQEQLARRAEDERWRQDRAARPTYAELKTKHGENWGLQAREPRDEAAESDRGRRAYEQGCEQAVRSWGDEPAQSIAGIPISRHLAEMLGRTRR